MCSIVEIRNVSMIYNQNTDIEVKALKNLNLQVQKGEFLSIVGPSGSGKSTLLHLLGGLEKPTSGEIIVNNKKLMDMNDDEAADFRRKEVGFIFQKYNLIPILNVQENIILPATIEKDVIDDKYYNKLITFLKIDERLKHLPGELSGGQQQRVSIARALIMKPSIILADEPTGNLDQRASVEIVDYLKLLSREFKQTVILITHSMDLAEKGDRMFCIIDGVLKQECMQ